MNKDQAARSLFLQESFGVLSTISLDVPGYPFGSVVPYCADKQCRPVVYISHIAQHTKNIVADPRVSLTITEKTMNSDDVQARARITCLADAKPIGADEEDGLRERYFRYTPSARQYELTHGFAFFRLELVRIRFIGGFGQIFWIEPDEFTMENPFSTQQESRIVDHMNQDHSEALRRYAGGPDAVMTGIDAEGFDMIVSGKKQRLEFPAPVRDMEQARQALIAMLKRTA
jgi:heme oxygenase (biliverdin-IX-beta and delta-forming)